MMGPSVWWRRPTSEDVVGRGQRGRSCGGAMARCTRSGIAKRVATSSARAGQRDLDARASGDHPVVRQHHRPRCVVGRCRSTLRRARGAYWRALACRGGVSVRPDVLRYPPCDGAAVTVDPSGADQPASEVLGSLLEGCQVVGPDFRYLYLNDVAVEHARLPRERLLGHTMMECFPGIEKTPMFQVLRTCMHNHTHHRLENEFQYPDGTTGWFELRFVPLPESVCVLSLDITSGKRSAAELVRVEAQLRQAQKMEAVGRLAGGVAHDFNNLLTVVLSYTELLLSDMKHHDPVRRDLEEIQNAGVRALELTGQLSAFSRQRVQSSRVVDLNQVIRGLQNMLGRVLGADIELLVLPAPALGNTRADPSSIEQILLNLVVNARDAMPVGGQLTIESKNVELDADYARSHLDVEPGSYVMLAVSDSGTGMDRETQSKIFEPFFTTKAAGRGTGLGLSTVYGLVKQNGGHIWLYSEPGTGTTFKLYFRRTDDPEDRVLPRVSTVESVLGSETILVVEDDPQVRAVASTVLRRNGYRVLDAANGGEALLTCEKHTGTIHLLLTDVILPKMSGRELVHRLATLRPQMKVLFMSGYTDDAVMQHGILSSEVAYLQKPLTPGSLTRKVRVVLDSTGSR